MEDKKLLNRKTYKIIKKYDRQQMENYIENIYKIGFKDGVDAGNNADFKIKLVELLDKTKGVGEKTTEKILNALKEMEKGA